MRNLLLRNQLVAASLLLVVATPTTAAATALQEPACVANGFCERSALWILSFSASAPAVEQLLGDGVYSYGGGARISQPVNGEYFSGDKLEGGDEGDLADIRIQLYQEPSYDGVVDLFSSVAIEIPVHGAFPIASGYGSVAMTLQETLQVQTLVPIRLRYSMGSSQTPDGPPGDLVLDATMSINVRNVSTGEEILALTCCSGGEVLIAAAAGDVIEANVLGSAMGSATTGVGGSLSRHVELEFVPVPEPSTALLVALGLAALASRRVRSPAR